MTWLELAISLGARNEQEAKFALWEKTAFPMCDKETVIRQLKEFFSDRTKGKDHGKSSQHKS